MRTGGRFFCAISMSIILSGCVNTAQHKPDGQYLRSLSDLEAGRIEAGFNRILACAQGGHPGCMKTLGELLVSGKGAAPDPREALRWQKYAFSTGLDGGFDGVFGALNAARYFCDLKEVNGTYTDVETWTDRAEQLNNRLLQDHPFGKSTSHSAARVTVQAELSRLRKTIKQRECVAASG